MLRHAASSGFVPTKPGAGRPSPPASWVGGQRNGSADGRDATMARLASTTKSSASNRPMPGLDGQARHHREAGRVGCTPSAVSYPALVCCRTPAVLSRSSCPALEVLPRRPAILCGPADRRSGCGARERASVVIGMTWWERLTYGL